MKKLLSLYFLFLATSLLGQEIYIVNNLTTLKTISTLDFTVTDLFDLGVTTNDLAFSPSGQLYGITTPGDIIEIDLINQSYTIIASFPTGDTYTALVANDNNELITSKTASEELYSYNLDNGDITLLQNGIATPGDFTFFMGNLIYPNYDDDFIRAYDGTDITNVGCAVNQLYTFVSVFDDCQNESIYGIDSLARIYLYDILNETFNEIASVGPATGNVFGGATMSEWMGASCNLVNLSEIPTCTLSLENLVLKPFRIFPIPTANNVFIESLLSFDSYTYTLYDIGGKLLSSESLAEGKLSLYEFNSGVYFLNILDSEGVVLQTQKLIKN